MGSVYVFNSSSQRVMFSINRPDNPTFMIDPTSAASPHPYTPNATSIERVNSGGSGKNVFVNDAPNTVMVQAQGRNSNAATLQIPAAPQAPDPGILWLYVFPDLMLLLETSGHIVQRVPIEWPS